MGFGAQSAGASGVLYFNKDSCGDDLLLSPIELDTQEGKNTHTHTHAQISRSFFRILIVR